MQCFTRHIDVWFHFAKYVLFQSKHVKHEKTYYVGVAKGKTLLLEVIIRDYLENPVQKRFQTRFSDVGGSPCY